MNAYMGSRSMAPLILNLRSRRKWVEHHISAAVKVKVQFTLEQATKPQRGSRGIALLFL